MKIDWKRKLTSRKWWMSIITLVVAMIQLFGAPEQLISQVSGTIMAIAAVVSYTIAEGMADSANIIEIETDKEAEEDE